MIASNPSGVAGRVADTPTEARSLGAASLVASNGAVFDFPSRFSPLRPEL